MTNRTKWILGAVAVVVVVVGGGLWWFFSGDEPEEVSLEAATDQVTTTEAADGTTTTATSDGEVPTGDGIDGAWTVDAETGDFDFQSATGSFAGFRVQEELSSIGSSEAVGRTGEVSGTITISGTTLESAEIEVDMASITTDKSRRDNKVQEALQTDQFPNATFSLTEPVDLGAGAATGEPVEVDAVGDLTVHGVTHPVTVSLEAQLVEGTAVVVGSVPVNFSEYGVEAPSAPMVLSVSDEATVEWQLLFTPG